MRLSKSPSLADQLAPVDAGRGDDLILEDGSRVGVVGGGPAGTLFSYFLLRMADDVGLDLSVDIFEPRFFTQCGPAGCNHCGGIVSESLVQLLAADGINLPPEVIQRGIGSYVLHMDVGSVQIAPPRDEQRIAAVYRGNGPRTGEDMPWESFDAYLQTLAVGQGARVVRKLVSEVRFEAGLPVVVHPDGKEKTYELLALAAGVNSNLLKQLGKNGAVAEPRETVQTYICEFRCDPGEITRAMGHSMHVFLLDLPRLEFAALIPKGEFITMCLLGDNIDGELVESFLKAPEVRGCLPSTAGDRVCQCSPLINLRGGRQPFGDRFVQIGDCGVTRLYKDGIGAAYRTAKAAATTAVFHGISARDFAGHYATTCQSIERDNRIGKAIFAANQAFNRFRLTRRAILRMTAGEQTEPAGARRMSRVLWNLFTGSAPYADVLKDSLHPGFLVRLGWNLLAGLRGSRATMKGGAE